MIERAQFPAKIQNVPCGVNTTCWKFHQHLIM